MSDETDKLNEIVRDTKASWQDEYGIRGPQPEQGRSSGGQGDESVTTGDVRRQPVQPPFPADKSTGEATGDSADYYGANAGAPAIFDLVQNGAPRPAPPIE